VSYAYGEGVPQNYPEANKQEKLLPGLGPIVFAQACAKNYRAVRDNRVLLIASACGVKKKHAKITVPFFGNEANVLPLIIFDGPILYERQSYKLGRAGHLPTSIFIEQQIVLVGFRRDATGDLDTAE
jgi:hypothetical protein